MRNKLNAEVLDQIEKCRAELALLGTIIASINSLVLEENELYGLWSILRRSHDAMASLTDPVTQQEDGEATPR